MAVKRGFPKAKSEDVFGQARKSAKMFRAGVYARLHQRSAESIDAVGHAARVCQEGCLMIVMQIGEIGSGGARRELRRGNRPVESPAVPVPPATRGLFGETISDSFDPSQVCFELRDEPMPVTE